MKALGILGTSSSAGKSWMTTALCAWLRQQGVRVAPFKAQNMSNNAWATLEGGEMARAQAVQAEACGLRPHADMNPILLKPSGAQGSQLILRGVAQGHLAAQEYYRDFDRLWRLVADTLESWRARCDVLVLEGAGSPVELNLMDRDLVNLRPLRHLDGRWLLVSDIDRGGVYAQLAGTWNLLPSADRTRGLGAIINRFRGDLSLFPNPTEWLAPHAPGLNVLGTVPLRPDLQPEEEDGLSASDEDRGSGEVIGWIRLPHAANLTDCQPWWDDSGVRTRWIDSVAGLGSAGAIVLPGSKNTLADLLWLRRTGLAAAIIQAARDGMPVIGLCGGFQILGQRLVDPGGVAGDAGDQPGLGLLPIATTFRAEKIVRQVTARCGSREWTCYEVHMGRSEVLSPCSPLHVVRDLDATERPEGLRCGNIWGTYLHGWFEAPEARASFAAAARIATHRTPTESYAGLRQKRYAQMAAHLAAHVDLRSVTRYLGL
jgi:adenosylcobyric acid synthase